MEFAGPLHLDPPDVLYLSVPASDICNYRCRHCHIWLHDKRPDPLSRARRLELVDEFAALNPGGTVVVPGGEVALEPDELFPVTGACARNGLKCIVLTNGSTVVDQAQAERIADCGVTLLSVSLDSHRPELHNYTRGVETAFDETTRAVRLLVAARSRARREPTVIVTSVLFRENLPLVEEFVEYVRSLGAMHVEFQLLGRTFANAQKSGDHFFSRHFWHTATEKEDAKRILRAALERYADDPFVLRKPADLSWMQPYIDDPDYRTAAPICGSHYTNMIVDSQGNVALCFNTHKILEQPFVGNAARESLAALWAGTKAEEDRGVMDQCRLNCGALLCHRRRKPAAALTLG